MIIYRRVGVACKQASRSVTCDNVQLNHAAAGQWQLVWATGMTGRNNVLQ